MRCINIFLFSLFLLSCNEKEKTPDKVCLKSDAYLQNQLEQQYTDSYMQLDNNTWNAKVRYFDPTASKHQHEFAEGVLKLSEEINSLKSELVDMIEVLKWQLCEINGELHIREENEAFHRDSEHLHHYKLVKINNNSYNSKMDSLLYLSDFIKQIRKKIQEFPNKVIESNNKYNTNNIFSSDEKRINDFKRCFSSNNLFTSKKNDNLLANLALSRIIILLTTFEIHLEKSTFLILDKFYSTSRVENYNY